MGFLNHISIKGKLLLINSIVLVAMLIMSATAIIKTLSVSSEYKEFVTAAKAENSCDALTSGALQCIASARNLYIDPKDETSRANLQKSIDALSKTLDETKKINPKGYDVVSKSVGDFMAEAQLLYSKSGTASLALDDLKHSTTLWRGLKENLTKVKKDADNSQVDKKGSIDSDLQSMPTILSVIAIITLLIIFALMYMIQDSILSPLHSLKMAVSGLLSGNADAGQKIKVVSEDEVGEIAKQFNSYLSKIAEDLEQDAKAINQLNEVANLAATGIFAIRMSESGASPQVKQAINSVNAMLNSIEDATSKLTKGMIEFASANYQYKLETTGYAGSIGSMAAGLTGLGNSNSELFAMITISGEQLEAHAQDLTRESEELSSAANEQAANLEETAAALEEMTSNIHSTTDKAAAMAKSASEAKEATLTGAKMADVTAKAMVEIAEATKSINEAVAIIENIAFQTNILSLNAAVEAATAGEAGKGFAVVAQEVRNLANRSAEAAKQIKALTETAKTKSEDGLKISDSMNVGFKTIAEKIDQTARMVEEVANASKEQMQGISQINDAVTQLDQVTQQNAAAANGVSHMSQIVLDLATSLLDAAGKTKFDASKRNMVCNIDMIFDTTKLKLDHIKFKETNFSKVKMSSSSFAVTDHHSCALGKWLDTHKATLQNSSAWHKMEVAHAHVHTKVKEFCDRGVGTNPNSANLSTLAKDIENDTLSVFECLDEFKTSLCANSNNEHTNQGMISL